MEKTKTSSLIQFFSHQGGIAATEFALVFPILIALLLGSLEGGGALIKDRATTSAVEALVEIAALEMKLAPDDIDDLMIGIEQIIDDPGAEIDLRLVSVVPDTDGTPMVHWSYGNIETEPYSAGAPYPNPSIAVGLSGNSSLIIAELEYPYSVTLGSGLISDFLFKRSAVRWPRRSARIEFCTAPGNCI